MSAKTKEAVVREAKRIFIAATTGMGFPAKRQWYDSSGNPTYTEFKDGYGWANDLINAYRAHAKSTKPKGKRK